MDDITLYTIGCPKCKVLEKKLELSGIKYNVCTDIEVMESKGFKTSPILEVNGVVYAFADAVKLIGSLK